jgi:hypothetical protein
MRDTDDAMMTLEESDTNPMEGQQPASLVEEHVTPTPGKAVLLPANDNESSNQSNRHTVAITFNIGIYKQTGNRDETSMNFIDNEHQSHAPGAHSVLPIHRFDHDLVTEDGVHFSPNLHEAQLVAENDEDGQELSVAGAFVHPDDRLATEAIVGEPAQGFYVKKRHIVLLVSLLMAVILMVGVASGLSTQQPAMDGNVAPTFSIVLPTTIQKLADNLPIYTVALLQGELNNTDTSHTAVWYNDPLWTNNNDAAFQPQSPQGKAWKWLMTHKDLQSRSLIDVTERFALATLYFATDGPHWENNTYWLSTTADTCDWLSVVSDPSPPIDLVCLSGRQSSQDTGRTSLVLTGNGLSGTLPPELGLMNTLTKVRFDSNSLHGTIHEAIWQSWHKVQSLYLQNNHFSGTLPSTIGLLIALGGILIHVNQISGTLPTELGKLTGLVNFDIHHNLLTGKIPTEVGQMKSYAFGDFSQNSLTGPIPTELGNLQMLQSLFLGSNNLSGTIPKEFALCQQLNDLDLSSNALLAGSIPPEIGHEGSLRLWLMNNSSITGTLPSQLSGLASLAVLDVSNTQINGTLPADFGQLSRLGDLRIYGTKMSGSIPKSVCQSLTSESETASLLIDCARVKCDCNCTCA